MDNQTYNLILHNNEWFESFFTMKYPVIPEVNDLIMVEDEKTLFKVHERCFKPLNGEGEVEVVLFGTIESAAGMSRFKWERMRGRINDQKQEIVRDSEGMVVFPDTL
jgi:hypothetical protein